MSINLEDILNQVKQVEETKLKKEKGGFKNDPRLLNLKKNCTYTIRLIPNIKDINNTFVSYKEVGFKSRVNGAFIYGGRSPQDAGIKDDLYRTTQWAHYSAANEKGDDVEKKASYTLLPQRKQLVNAYLVSVDGDDPEAREKVGQVVVVRYTAQVAKDGTPLSDIFKRIHSAIFGDMNKKIGAKALDLSEKGKSLVIRVTEKAGYNNYSDTYFDDAEDIGLSPERIAEIMSSAHDLNEFVPEVKSPEEIKQLLNAHWFGINANHDDELDDEDVPPMEPVRKSPSSNFTSDDEIPMGKGKTVVDDDLDSLLDDV